MTNFVFSFYQIIVLLLSVVVHEYMHAWMANELGDNTAKLNGRLTLNPLPHLDLFGSILMPLMMFFSGIPLFFAYAKPVPCNPNNFSDKKYGEVKVALAGPLGNFILALFFGLFLRFFSSSLDDFLEIAVLLNLYLMFFNLIPIPPLDGSRILEPFLSYQGRLFFRKIEPYGFLIIIFFISLGIQIINPFVSFFYRIIVGI